MNNGNKYKYNLLGEPIGTATAKLRKSILFKLIQMLDLDICFQCGKKIETVDDFSIEHKVPWQSANNPRDTFYDLNNIAFSHLHCNITNANKGVPRPGGRGELHSQARLKNKDVLEVKKRLFSGEKSCVLAREFGVADETICNIKKGRAWRNIK
jgi:hypothetical protein